MTCREFNEFLMAYLDRELPKAELESFEAHLAECPPCVVYLDQYRETVRLGRSICEPDDGPIPDNVPERLIQAVLASRRSTSS